MTGQRRSTARAQEFAIELRNLRVAAGSPSFRAMAAKAHFAASTLAEATRGVRLPSRAVVEAFAVACGADPVDLVVRWKHAAADLDEPAPPPTRDTWAALVRLPPDLPDFVGRAEEIDWLDRAVQARDNRRTAVLSGAPGNGKTTLAVHFAHRSEAFADGRLCVDLHGMDPEPPTAQEIAASVVRALSPRDAVPPEDVLAAYRMLLADRSLLLVLDNAADEQQVRPLLAPGPSGFVVVTGRSRLSGLQGVRRLHLDAPTDEAAIAMLARIIGEERAAREPKAAAELVRRCGWLPLAVRVVGNNVDTRPEWPLDYFTARLADASDGLSLLRSGDVDVRSAFMVSYRNVAAEPATLFRRLSLVPGPDFDADIAAALIGEPPARTGALLDGLTDMSLLEPTAVPGRYRFHDLLRVFAAEMLVKEEPPESRVAAADAVLHAVLGRAADAGALVAPPTTVPVAADSAFHGNRDDAVAWLDLHWPHVLAAHRSSARRGWHDVVGRTAAALIWYCDLRCVWSDLLTVSGLAVDAARTLADDNALAEALNSHGLALHGMSRFADAIGDHQRALDCAVRAGNLVEQANAQDKLGLAYLGLGEPDKAADCHRRDVEIACRLGDRWSEAAGRSHLGNALAQAGRTMEAIENYQTALRILVELGDLRGQAMAMNALGLANSDAGRFGTALTQHREALATFTRFGDEWAGAFAHYGLGRALAGKHDLPAAMTEFEESLRIFESVPDRHWIARVRQEIDNIRAHTR